MEIAAPFLPDGLPGWAAALVIAVSFFSSALTAAFGLGGGLILLAVMSAALPAPAVIPIHGVAQLGSNAGRFYLQRQHIVWPIVLWFSLGGLVGAVFGGKLAVQMPLWVLRGGVAIFIIYTLWGPRPKGFEPGVKTFVGTGAVAAFLTMFFGATGPIAATMLSATRLDRLRMVATHAACMVGQHTMKIAVFGLLGFAYGEWALFIAAVLVVGFAGTWLGTHYLNRMPEAVFRRGFRLALTLVAIYLVIAAINDFRTG